MSDGCAKATGGVGNAAAFNTGRRACSCGRCGPVPDKDGSRVQRRKAARRERAARRRAAGL